MQSSELRTEIQWEDAKIHHVIEHQYGARLSLTMELLVHIR